MGTWVFGMQRGDVERLPCRVALRLVIAVDVAVADGSHWPPEQIVPFCFVHRLHCISLGNSQQGHKSRCIDHRHILGYRDLPHPSVVGDRTSRQPEACSFSLLWRAFGAVLLADFLDLVVVTRPSVALEIGRRAWTELFSAFQNEGLGFC